MTRRTLEIAAFCIALIVAVMAVHAWLASRDEQQRLAATLAAQKQVIDAANADEHARQASLADALAQIEKLKRDVQTPAQILAALPKYLQLPQPITLEPTRSSAAPSEQGTAASAERSRSTGVIPNPAPTHSVGDGDEGSAFAIGVQNQQQIPRGSSRATANATDGQSTRDSARDDSSPGVGASAQIPAADLKPLFDYVQDCRACQAQLAAAQKNSADDAAKIAALTRERDAAVTASKGGSFFRQLRRNALWFAIGAAGGYIAARR